MRKLLAPLFLSMLVLSGCANAATDGNSPEATGPTGLARVLQQASAKTLAAGSAHLRFDLSVQTGRERQVFGGDADLNFGGNDPTKVEADLTMELPKTIGSKPGSMELIIDAGPVLYLNAPLLTGFLGAKTPWIKIDPSTVPGMSSQLGSLTDGQTDPTGSFGFLYGVVDVTSLGHDTIEGVDAIHYRATVDLNQALQQIPAAQRASLQQALKTLEQRFGSDSLGRLPIDVWVDASGYLKRFQYRFDVPTSSTVTGGSFSVTMTLSNVGRPVDIQPPPPDRVTDITDLLPQPTSGASTTTTG